MKEINRIFSKLVTVVLSGIVAVSGIPCNAVSVSSSENNEIPELNVIYTKEGETSEYGLTPVYYVDENGNEVEPELIPEKNDKASDLPSRYDLRDYGYITSVKSQGETGTCWAHATIASCESNMIMNRLADNTIDLSESHLAWFALGKASTDKNDPLYNDGLSLGTDAYGNGGNSAFSMAVLARWSGVQLEKNAPSVTKCPIIDESQRYTSYGYLANSDELDKNDRESIKQHLMSTGALMCSYYDDDSKHIKGQYYPYASYYNSDINETNHAVTIVGWDDNYSKNNFNGNVPPANGAWIIKNSWGDDSHIDGYFYLSYYDTSLSRITSFEIADTSKYNNNYQYDGASPENFYYYQKKVYTGANVFTAENNETVSAVAFYTKEASVPYVVSVYADVKDGNPSDGKLLITQKGTMDYAGYHTVDLVNPVSVSKGTKFSVVVTLDKVGAKMAIQKCTNLSDCSYYTSGIPNAKSSWYDMIENYDSTACIKALTRSEVLINETNFPDSIFRNYVSRFDNDSDGALSYDEIISVNNMDLSGRGVSDFTGIEFFTELTDFNCAYNPIVKLDLSHNNKLDNFICYGCSMNVGDVKCNGFTVDGLDMSRISDVKGMTLKDSLFVPEKTTMSYTYNCGRNYSFQMVFKADSLVHSYGSWKDNGDSHIKTCYYCNDVKSEEHSFGEWKGGTEEHSHTCQICGVTKSEEHSFGDWSYDGTTHVHSCTICGVSEMSEHIFSKFEPYDNEKHKGICETCGYTKEFPHNFSEWEISDNGSHIRECKDCGYTETVEHNFSDWTESGRNTHTRVCVDCGYTEVLTHEFGEWTDSDNGTHTRECKVCGYTETVEHNFGEWTESDKNTHSRTCADCGYTEVSKHEFGEWTDSGDGIHSRTCKTCGYTESSEHVFGDWTESDEYNHIRTCTDCGYTESFPHNFGEWQDNGNATYIKICSDCGYSEIKEIEYILGDINGDGRTDSFDLVLARQKFENGFDNSVELASADVNNDGIFNENDIILIRDFILGKIEQF